MKKLILSLIILLSTNSYAIDFGGFDRWDVTKWTWADTKLLEVKAVYLDYMHYTFAAEPFMLPNVPTNRLDLHVDLEFFNRTFFLDNMIHSETDQSQFALIGWNYRLGVHIGDYVDFYLDHYSQHLLDVPDMNGPNTYDSIGVRIYFYKRK